jgi:hypothetical protein
VAPRVTRIPTRRHDRVGTELDGDQPDSRVRRPGRPLDAHETSAEAMRDDVDVLWSTLNTKTPLMVRLARSPGL